MKDKISVTARSKKELDDKVAAKEADGYKVAKTINTAISYWFSVPESVTFHKFMEKVAVQDSEFRQTGKF